MEQNEKNKIETAREENAETTQMSHEEMQKKLKKQRIRQIIASVIGVAILAFGLWKIVCLFLDYNANTKVIRSLSSTTVSIASD